MIQRFRGREADVREIGKQLNVGAVLEGSVQRSGETLESLTTLPAARISAKSRPRNGLCSLRFTGSATSRFV
jgi:hypothetical protein